MVLETSWGTAGGWVIVRDALLIGPVAPRARTAPTRTGARRPTTTPTTCCCAPCGASTARCSSGSPASPAFDYGAGAARRGSTTATATTSRSRARAGSDLELRLTTDLNLGIEGPRVTGRHLIKEGEAVVLRAVVERARARRRLRGGLRAARLDRPPLAALARPRRLPRPPVARGPAALRAHAQGPHLRADRARSSPPRRRRCPRRPGGERNWDYRYSWIRDSTFALWGLYTLGFDWEANDFFYFVADVAEAEQGTLQIMYGIDGRAELPERTLDHLSGYENARPVRVGNAAHSQAQHDVWGAVLDSVYLHTKSRDALPEQRLADADPAGRGGAGELAQARPRHLGGARRAAALHLVQADVLGGAGPRRPARRAARGLGARGRWRAVADEIHADICAQRARRRAACSRSTTTPTRSTRPCC